MAALKGICADGSCRHAVRRDYAPANRTSRQPVLRRNTIPANQTKVFMGHCEVALYDSQVDAVDPRQLVMEAVVLLNEALVLLDAAMAHQPAALVDMAINILAGWTPGTSGGADVISPEPH